MLKALTPWLIAIKIAAAAYAKHVLILCSLLLSFAVVRFIVLSVYVSSVNGMQTLTLCRVC